MKDKVVALVQQTFRRIWAEVSGNAIRWNATDMTLLQIVCHPLIKYMFISYSTQVAYVTFDIGDYVTQLCHMYEPFIKHDIWS